jgi:hypothetical protein
MTAPPQPVDIRGYVPTSRPSFPWASVLIGSLVSLRLFDFRLPDSFSCVRVPVLPAIARGAQCSRHPASSLANKNQPALCTALLELVGLGTLRFDKTQFTRYEDCW